MSIMVFIFYIGKSSNKSEMIHKVPNYTEAGQVFFFLKCSFRIKEVGFSVETD